MHGLVWQVEAPAKPFIWFLFCVMHMFLPDALQHNGLAGCEVCVCVFKSASTEDGVRLLAGSKHTHTATAVSF